MPGENDNAVRATRVRYAIIALVFIITSLNYADRSTFSIAGAAASDELGLTTIQTGFILSAFAWAYAAAQIPGGALLDRFGTRPVYIAAIATWSGFTMLQGFVGFLTGASVVVQLFMLRFLVGFCEAPSFPGNARIVAAWFPARERGTASAIFNSAQYFSLVAFAPLMGWIVHSLGWRAVFFVMGALGLLAALTFATFIRDPARHKGVNQAELDLIREGGGLVELDSQVTGGRTGTFTWHNVRQLLTSRMMVGIYLGQYCINVLTYFFVTWFPIYLVRDRGFDILQAGFVAAVPALCGFLGGVAGGVLSDRLLARTGSLTLARKAPLLGGMLLASLIMAAAYVDSQAGVILLMSLAFFGKGVASLGWAVMSDVAPRQLAGLAGGVFNTFGNAAGIVTPIVVGLLVAQAGSFDTALIFVGAHCLLTIFAYFVIVQKVERLELQP
ncbi:d-galactonate transporter [Sphingobium chlorophenolicum L-1]|uniref:D-galactonate transporter n=1 Tax=Sphingobium chlorophenolicum L-1 TaxID=690566 RepID=F6F2Q3_SPHCR|nr:MFS transporter [Sphingobium chlorophenolicum]AEG50715.1 d-galactonate transporter [Sphingobium chlorophenolicum L-1]